MTNLKSNPICQKDPNFSIWGIFPLLHNEHSTSVHAKHFSPKEKSTDFFTLSTHRPVNHMGALIFRTSLTSTKRWQANTS